MPHHPSARHIIALYDRHARHWDRLRSNHFNDRKWIERFASSLPPSSGVLDLGCGAGQPVAGAMIEAGHAVTGVDSSARMIAMCRERFAGHTWIQADMRTLDLNRRFDGILAWNSFFHLHYDDQRGMFPLFQRHAAPGALLMFTSGTGLGEALGEFQGETLYHASLDPQEYANLLQEHGFEVLDHVVEDPQSGGLTIWLCRALPC
ncbi:methyltransferase domain-containing protein [Pseudomonas sp. 148P]|uniref:Methyltransferase domain-containing protein n=1 Tax=Pseudomonas ulcerans TaxID=3115852 RepID=A0ABU7HNM9_9PSED|nr:MULTISPECIES: methyltransferase domain-containing protein [unclassified Pseudomonas]MEE1923626.1 methyltransferase domain-containing protein [Pseudomonas sp. 147P]MEE1933124.1 methyltransferase domain-containing protein [Pseudomonas sp. 148P]